jgi:hypothetical protein
MALIDKTKISKGVFNKYSILNDSFVCVQKSDPKDRIDVEIGDTKDLTKFQNQIKMMRWNNEVNASFRLINKETGTEKIETRDNKIVWSKGNIETHYYDIAEGEGSHEMEIIFKKKPKTNILEFSIETKGLEFFLQPELTDDEAQELATRKGITLIEAKRSMRPENVIDSYAVYYKECPINREGGKLYRTGKAFHIYRIKATDANGVSVWGKQNIDVAKKLHTMTFPQEFLDTCTYPISIK